MCRSGNVQLQMLGTFPSLSGVGNSTFFAVGDAGFRVGKDCMNNVHIFA